MLNLSFKKQRHLKIISFFGFIHYNWGHDKQKGSAPWEIYKEVHDYKNASPLKK